MARHMTTHTIDYAAYIIMSLCIIIHLLLLFKKEFSLKTRADMHYYCIQVHSAMVLSVMY